MTTARLFSGLAVPVERLVAALCDPARRERTVILVLSTYAAVWTLYGVLAKASQDVHTDMAEMVVWSRELALGYPKHPPLAAWLTGAWFAVFPAADWSFYLLAMTVAAVALWIAWRLAGDYLDGEKRVLALVLLMLVPFFNFHALKFNANTILLPLWAATALCFLRSYERRSAGWAALAGLCAAGAMLGKYWSVFLLAGLGIAALLDSRRGAYFRSAAPWITIAAGAALLAPHVAWLVAHDFAPIKYANVVHATVEASAAMTAVGYIAGSIAYVAVPVLLCLAAIRPNRAALVDMLKPETPARRLAAAAFWSPLLLPLLAPLLTGFGITSLWSMSSWALLPVVLLSSRLVSVLRPAMLATVAIAIGLPPVMIAAAPSIAMAIHRGGGLPPASVHSRLLAERVLHEWRLVTDRPLRMVGGDGALAFGVAFYLPGRPSAFPDFQPEMAPWVDQARVRHDGIAIVCQRIDAQCVDRPASLGFTGPRIGVDVTRDYRGVAGRTGSYVIVIVPPRP